MGVKRVSFGRMGGKWKDEVTPLKGLSTENFCLNFFIEKGS